MTNTAEEAVALARRIGPEPKFEMPSMPSPSGPGNFLHSNKYHAEEILFRATYPRIPRARTWNDDYSKDTPVRNDNRQLDTHTHTAVPHASEAQIMRCMMNHNTHVNGATLLLLAAYS